MRRSRGQAVTTSRVREMRATHGSWQVSQKLDNWHSTHQSLMKLSKYDLDIHYKVAWGVWGGNPQEKTEKTGSIC